MIYFCSDQHLPKNEEKFLSFLDKVRGELFILGDLFDFYYEFKYYIPKWSFNVFRKLREIIEKGVKVNYMHGNHDPFKISFLKDIGVDVITPGFYRIEGKIFYLAHSFQDTPVKYLGSIIKFLHPDFVGFFGLRFARFLEGLPKRKSLKREIEEAKRKLKFCDYVVVGHYHRVFELVEGDKKIIFLSGWDEVNYAVYDGDLRLCFCL